MYPWAFCPACHLVPLWSLLHTLYPIWAAGLGQGEKDLSQTPNCIKLSNKALLSLKEKRIKNSCYIYSGKKRKKKPHSQITGSPSSLIELCQQQPSHFSFPSLPRSPEWKADYCLSKKSRSSQRKKTIFNTRQCSSLFALSPAGMRRPVSKIEFVLWISASGVKPSCCEHSKDWISQNLSWILL